MFITKKRSIIFSVLAILSFAVFIFLLVSVVVRHTLKMDELGIVLAEHRTTFLNGFFEIFTHMGSVFCMIFITILMLIFHKRQGVSVALCLAIVGLICVIIKYAIQRVRPDYNLIAETGYSFPSAHAMMSICFYGYLIYLSQKLKVKYKLFISISLSISIILLGFSRVYLGVHFMSDVLAGWCLGFVVLVLFVLASELLTKHRQTRNKTIQ